MKELAKIIARLKVWWNIQTKQYHWFEVKYSYLVDGKEVFSWIAQTGVNDLRLTLDRRDMKKSLTPLHKWDETKNLKLQNGKIDALVICYLGRFAKKETK